MQRRGTNPIRKENDFMKRFGKRFLIVLLCSILSLTVCPVSVWAAEETEETEVSADYAAEAEERKNEEIQSNSIEGWPKGPARRALF